MTGDEGRFGTLGAQPVCEFAATLARPGVGPAAGAMAAMAAALAAGLGEKTAHGAGDADTRLRLQDLRALALELADEDTVAFAAFLSGGTAADREPIVTVPVRIAETAARITSLLADLRPRMPRALHADVAAAALLASSASRCIVEVLEANLVDHRDARLEHVRELARGADDVTRNGFGDS